MLLNDICSCGASVPVTISSSGVKFARGTSIADTICATGVSFFSRMAQSDIFHTMIETLWFPVVNVK